MTTIEQFISMFGFDQRQVMTENLANMSDERKAEFEQRILALNQQAKKALEAVDEYRAAVKAAPIPTWPTAEDDAEAKKFCPGNCGGWICNDCG